MNSSASSSSVNSGGGSGGTADGGDGSDTASGGGGGGGGTGSEIDRGGSFVTSNSTSMINKSFVLRKPTQTGNMQHSTDLHPTTGESAFLIMHVLSKVLAAIHAVIVVLHEGY